MAKLTVAIPTHTMEGGVEFLKQSLDILNRQTFKDFDVVVSDNSDDDDLKKVCDEYSQYGNYIIKYFKNPNKGMAQNTNAAIEASEGELIKILYLDDYLYGREAIEAIVKSFRSYDHWLVSGCVHTFDGIEVERPHYPNFHEKIYNGGNTIGSPSVLTIRNEGHILFDEQLTWLLDCDLYKRYHNRYGNPRLLNSLNVVIRQGRHQMTELIPDGRKQWEYNYLMQKHG